ncbi:unnamed protein product [Durusdinium trenchii]|uniref:Cysteine-rich venom protein pseudecin (CRVP Pdc) n=2 Tax=Durusdinium trenchii TaxID=1381693 RepID=A0ABP0K865_9DINO
MSRKVRGLGHLTFPVSLAVLVHGDFQTRCPGEAPYVEGLVAPLCTGHFPEKGSTSFASWIVHFYGCNCRRCRETALMLQDVLTEEPVRQSSLKFGAVDCQQAQNRKLCKSFNIWKFPVLMAMGSSSRYSGPLDVNSVMEWMEGFLRLDALVPVSNQLIVCPAFELYEEPRLASEFLTAHNIFRCMAGIPMLEWDLHAFQTARAYASRAPTDRLSHSDPAERRSKRKAVYGENVALGQHLRPGQVVARWYDEIRNTQGGKFRPKRAGLGHYTQLVWRKTLRVGCSLGQDRRVAVCHYDPGGNEKGKHLSQVAPPLPGFFGIEGQERCGAIVEQIGAS